MMVGGKPPVVPEILGQIDPSPSKSANCQLIFAPIASAVTSAKTFYTVSRKKRDQDVFCNSSYKSRAMLTKCGNRFPNKFAGKRCKRFPPHLNNVSTLPCETWNAHCARATICSHCFSLFRTVMPILYTFSCNSPTRCNQLDSNLANLGAQLRLYNFWSFFL